MVWLAWRTAHAVALVVLGGDPVATVFRFDGQWYADILANGYQLTDPTFTQFQNLPFFPGLVWVTEPLSWILGNQTAAVVVANVTGFTAFVTVFAALRATFGEPAARRGVVALALWPTSLVLTAYYSEGLFLSLTAAAVLADRTRRPVLGVCAATAAALTRPVGVAIGPVLGVVRIVRMRRVDATAVAYLASGPVGIAVVAGTQWQAVGSATGWMDAQRAWGRGVEMPWFLARRFVRTLQWSDEFPAEVVLSGVATVVVAVALVAISRRAWRDPAAWTALAWGWVAWGVPLWTRQPYSLARFVLAAWPALAAVTPMRRAVTAPLAVAGVVLSLWAVHEWTLDRFVG